MAGLNNTPLHLLRERRDLAAAYMRRHIMCVVLPLFLVSALHLICYVLSNVSWMYTIRWSLFWLWCIDIQYLEMWEGHLTGTATVYFLSLCAFHGHWWFTKLSPCHEENEWGEWWRWRFTDEFGGFAGTTCRWQYLLFFVSEDLWLWMPPWRGLRDFDLITGNDYTTLLFSFFLYFLSTIHARWTGRISGI